MCGNGARIGMDHIVLMRRMILRGQKMAVLGWSGAVVGATALVIADLPFGWRSIPMLVRTISVFVLPGIRNKLMFYHFTSPGVTVYSFTEMYEFRPFRASLTLTLSQRERGSGN